MSQFGPTLKLSFEGGGLTWHQDGNKFNYKRINSDKPKSGSTKIITLSKSEIENLTGKYSKDNSLIEISWKSNRLIFKKDSGNEKNLVLKKDYSFYYEANENGYQFKYPVEFRKSGNTYKLIYDGNITYSKD
jgi:hypothetical protein